MYNWFSEQFIHVLPMFPEVYLLCFLENTGGPNVKYVVDVTRDLLSICSRRTVLQFLLTIL